MNYRQVLTAIGEVQAEIMMNSMYEKDHEKRKAKDKELQKELGELQDRARELNPIASLDEEVEAQHNENIGIDPNDHHSKYPL